MTTIRQINALLTTGQAAKLARELSRFRADMPATVLGEFETSPEGVSLAAVALAAIRLQEIDQTHAPMYASLIGRLLKTQAPDGSWADGCPFVSAMAIRALLNWSETQHAATRGIESLSRLQRDDGSFPRTGPRRLPGDALATAFVLTHLGEFAVFADRIRLGAALHWLGQNRTDLAPEDRPLARMAMSRSVQHIAGQARKLIDLAIAA
jgi:hypothetical protein